MRPTPPSSLSCWTTAKGSCAFVEASLGGLSGFVTIDVAANPGLIHSWKLPESPLTVSPAGPWLDKPVPGLTASGTIHA